MRTSSITLGAPTPAVLRELVNGPEGPHVSIYLPLPERPGFDDLEKLPKTLGRMRAEALSRLSALDVSREEAEKTAELLGALDVDLSALASAAKGLALLVGPDAVKSLTLMRPVDAAVHVGRSFRARPVFAAARLERRYRVLALSAGSVRLFEGDAHGLDAVESREVPSSLEDALGSELTEPHFAAHSTAARGDAPAFHGHGGANAARAVDTERFHRAVARGLQAVWGAHEVPLVLFADASNHGRFRKLAHPRGLVETPALGNPDRMDAHALHTRAWPLVVDWIGEQDARARERAVDAHEGTVRLLEDALHAALAGRVERVFLRADARDPRHVDAKTGRLEEARGDEDALDELAMIVAAHGGTVVVDAGEPDVLAELRG